MDLERLKRVRDICFNNKHKSQSRRGQPIQNKTNVFNPQPDKENVCNMNNLSFAPIDQSASVNRQSLRSSQSRKRRRVIKGDPLKRLELEVTDNYERKQRALEENVRKYHEIIMQRRGRRQTRSTSWHHKGSGLSLSPNRKTRREQNEDDDFERYRSPSGSQLRNKTAARLSSAQRCFSPLFTKEELCTPFAQNSTSLQIRRVSDLLNKFINIAAAVMPSQQIEEMRLRLTGAFDRLIKIQKRNNASPFKSGGGENPFDPQAQLAKVIEGCLRDLELKLKSVAFSDSTTEQDLNNVRNFLTTITKQQALLDIEEILPKLLAFVNQRGQQYGVMALRNTINKLNNKHLRYSWQSILEVNSEKGRADRLLKHIVGRHQSINQYGKLTRTFQSWKDMLHSEPAADTLTLLQNYQDFFKTTITSQGIQSISNFFDNCKDFLNASLVSNTVKGNDYSIDLIFINNKKQVITYISDQEDQDRERIIDLSEQSLLKQFIDNQKKHQYFQNAFDQQKFNISLDIPFVKDNVNATIKSSNQSMQQLLIGLFKQPASPMQPKQLKFIVRISSNKAQSSLMDEHQQSKIVNKLCKLEQLIIQSFKVFRKLHYQFKNFNNQLCQQSSLSDKSYLFGQLQYLQSKSLELSYISTIQDCFTLVQNVVRELFNYDKCTLLQYTGGNQIMKLQCSSNQEEEILTLVNDSTSRSDVTERLIRELIQSQIFNSSNNEINEYIRQDCLEETSPKEFSGKSYTDIVLIALDLKGRDGVAEVSTLYQLTTEQNASGIQNTAPRYFMRLEKKLLKGPKDQEQFKQDELGLKSFIQLMLISINKMRIIQQQREQQHQKILEIIQAKGAQDSQIAEQEISKVVEENDGLRRLLNIQKVIDEFLDDLKTEKSNETSDTGLLYFEEFHLKLLSFLHVLIPKCKRMQLFLSKDSQGQMLYTYVNQPDKSDQSVQLGIQSPGFGASHQTRIRPHSCQRAYSNSRNTNNATPVYADAQQQVMSYQNVPIPSQIDDISSISPNDHTQLLMNNQANNSSNTSERPARPYSRKMAGQKRLSVEPMSRQASGLKLEPSSSSIGGNQNAQNGILSFGKHTSTFQHQNQHRNNRNSNLKRDYSAQTELNSNQALLLSNAGIHPVFGNLGGIQTAASPPQYQQRHQQIMIIGEGGQTSSSENRGQSNFNNKFGVPPILDNQSNQSSINNNQYLQQQISQQQHFKPTHQRQETFSQQPFINNNTMIGNLTSLDEVFHSQLHDDSELLQDFQTQDPSKIKRVDINVNQQKSLIGQAISFYLQNRQEKEGIMKRNVKNDKQFCQGVDNLVMAGKTNRVGNHQSDGIGQKKKRTLENCIYMPMINSKSQIIGLLQVANCDNQLIFTEHEMDLVRLIASKIANFISEMREKQVKKIKFQKQMQLSLIQSNLENQSVNKILTLANHLFQKEHNEPQLAVGYFVKKTEKYLRQTFNCQYSQLLLVHYDWNSLLSFHVQNHRAHLIRRADLTHDFSIANALVKNSFQDPVLWPGTSELDASSPQSHMNFYQQFINLRVDCPAIYNSEGEMPETYMAMTVRDQNEPTRVLGIVQIMCRLNSIRFTEHDINHLSLLCQQLSQVLSYIFNEGCLLSMYSEEQKVKVRNLVKLMQRKHKDHMKNFFRELLAFKFGKINLLKNKIMRKYMNKHMTIDQQLINKIQKLAEIREKVTMNDKHQAMDRLKIKVRQLSEQRQRNALKCLQVVNKYEKLLGIRVKDTVFKFWDRLRKEGAVTSQSNILTTENNYGQLSNRNNFNEGGVAPNEGILSPTFNNPYALSGLNANHDYSCYSMSSISGGQGIHSQSSFLEDSSITSALYIKAKSVYKMRKLFNKHRLQLCFHQFLLKTYHYDFKNSLFNLEGRRLLKLHSILSLNVRRLNQRVFDAFYQNSCQRHNQQKTLYKIASKRGLKDMSFGLKQWQHYTDKSMKQEWLQDKSQMSQIAEQARDITGMREVMQGLNRVFTRKQFDNVEECLQSEEVKVFLNSICEQISDSLNGKQQQIVITFKLPECYSQAEGTECLFGAFVYKAMHQASVSQTIQLSTLSPRVHSFITLLDANNDWVLKSFNTKPASILFDKSCLSLDLHTQSLLNSSLKLRRANHLQKGLFLPLLQQQRVFGSLEIYLSDNATCSSPGGLMRRSELFQQSSLTVGDQNRLQQQAQTIQIGLESFSQRLELIHQVSQIRGRGNLSSAQTLTERTTNSYSQIVYNLTAKIQTLMKANHCMLVFTSSERSSQIGHFYEFQTGQIFQVELSTTIIEDIKNTESVVTFPVEICQGEEMGDREETFESVTGMQYKAIKYIAIDMDKDLKVFVELGWSSYIQAEELHSNVLLLDKNLKYIRSIMISEINHMSRAIKLFTRTVDRKLKDLLKENWLRGCFEVWKQNSYIPTMLYYGHRQQPMARSSQVGRMSPTREQRRGHLLEEPSIEQSLYKQRRQSSHTPLNRDSASPSFNYRGRMNSRGAVSPLKSSLKKPQKLGFGSSNHKRSVSMGNTHTIVDDLSQNQQQQNYHHRSSRSISQASRYSNLERTPNRDNTIGYDEEPLELTEVDVERAAKRKLVASALVMISVQCRIAKKMSLKQALNEWKTFVMSTQIAEGAFNKLLELNHRHSSARFDAATHLLSKIARRHYGRCILSNLKSPPIQSPSRVNFHHQVCGPHHKRLFSADNYQQKSGQHSLTSTCKKHQQLLMRQQYVECERHHRERMSSPRYAHNEIDTPALPRNDNYDIDDTDAFEQEVFNLEEGSNYYNQERRAPFQVRQQMNQISVNDLESEFSLGTASGNKLISMHKVGRGGNDNTTMMNIENQEYAPYQQVDYFRPQQHLPQQYNLYQNMFKRF